MKKTFLLGLLLGIGGAVWFAGWYPIVDPVRFASESGVARNGGRTENFRIQIPEDRVLGTAAAPATGAGPSLPADTGGGQAEVYKLRNESGKVIGLASRVWRGGDTPYTDWTLMLPARGALFLTATGAGAAPVGETDAPQAMLGDVADGSREFTDFRGSFREEWVVTGRDADGRLVGAIEIMTLTEIRGNTP